METKVAHCPNCQKPILTAAELTPPMRLSMRCPYCQERLQVKVMVRVVAELMAGNVLVKQSAREWVGVGE